MGTEDFESSHNGSCTPKATTCATLKLSQREFTERCGNPARLIYKGQCYDAGSDPAAFCGACGGHIRFCYILKLLASDDVFSAKEMAKLRIGECCFHFFEKWNPALYCKLIVAKINLRTFVEAVERDKRVYGAETVPATGSIGGGFRKCERS
jgi:hypothetical protein